MTSESGNLVPDPSRASVRRVGQVFSERARDSIASQEENTQPVCPCFCKRRGTT